MKMTYKEIKDDLSKKWPNLRDIWLTDPLYWVPTLDDLKSALSLTETHRQTYLPDISDCDNFSLQLHAEISRLRAFSAIHKKIPKEEYLPWAFGQVMGLKFNNKNINHAINICYTTEGLYFIEPQTNEMWLANPKKNNIYFVRM